MRSILGYRFNADSNLVEPTRHDGLTVSYTHDHLNRETEEDWFPNATDAASSNTSQTNVVDYTYYANGRTPYRHRRLVELHLRLPL